MKKLFLLFPLFAMLLVGCTEDMLNDLQGLLGGAGKPDNGDIRMPNNEIWYTNGNTTEPTTPNNTD